MEFSAETIGKLINDGWRFRKKRRKKSYYVSARKGDKERSFGQFSDEKWSLVSTVMRSLTEESRDSSDSESAVKADDRVKEAISQLRSILGLAFRYCLHQDTDGFCKYWYLGSLPSKSVDLSVEEFSKLFKANDNGMKYWQLYAHPTLCRSCPSFEPRVKKHTNVLTRYSPEKAFDFHEK